MKKSVITLVVALVAGCSSMKINNDYDQQADFSSFKTYSWYETDSDLKDNYPLAHERLVRAVVSDTCSTAEANNSTTMSLTLVLRLAHSISTSL